MTKRFKILVGGEWQGGSFATEAEAQAAAATLPRGSKIEIVAKGATAAPVADTPAPAPEAPAPEPSSSYRAPSRK